MTDISDRPGVRLRHLMEPPESAPPTWFQARGRLLESILRDLLREEGLTPKMNLRPKGEEIDGSFLVDGRTYLLEAKWRKEPTPASELYSFKGKLDGKLLGTIGVFVTMNRFSADAVDALIVGKELNLILFSSDDLLHVADGRSTFADALRRKLRHAAEQGSPYLPLEPSDDLYKQPSIRAEASPERVTESWAIIVEGMAHERAINRLLARFDSPIRTLGLKV